MRKLHSPTLGLGAKFLVQFPPMAMGTNYSRHLPSSVGPKQPNTPLWLSGAKLINECPTIIVDPPQDLGSRGPQVGMGWGLGLGDVINYSLNRHPSGPENWPFFQRSHVCTWQCRTLKCSATHPAFSPVRNISRLFYFIFLLCQNQFQLRHSGRKWWPLTAWTLGRRISQLIAGGSTWRSGACFGTFLRLRFQRSLRQVRDKDSEENEKRKRPTHSRSSFAIGLV